MYSCGPGPRPINCFSARAVTDSTGAVVYNAKIVAHNMTTGEELTVVSGSAGAYALPSLPVGTYSLTISSLGLQTITAKSILLEWARWQQKISFCINVRTPLV